MFVFGHGLSYTRFEHLDLVVRGGDTISAGFTVVNTGDRAGVDVPQLYLTAMPGKPCLRLLGFERSAIDALEASNAAGLPPIAVSVQQGKFLSLLATAMGARRILELGTLGGFSTIWLAGGAGPQGRVVTLEYEPKHAEVARANLQWAGLADRVEVFVGAALDTLPSVTGPFDLVFIDADKENYPAYLDWAVRLARPGAVIVGQRDSSGPDPRAGGRRPSAGGAPNAADDGRAPAAGHRGDPDGRRGDCRRSNAPASK